MAVVGEVKMLLAEPAEPVEEQPELAGVLLDRQRAAEVASRDRAVVAVL